jgi:AcrR family transcriptional regulator
MASTKTRPKPVRRKTGENAQEVRRRILEAFSERAKRSGVRSVVMGELASELRMSPTTLYHHFSSKAELVTAMVERWSAEIASEDGVIRDASKAPLARFLLWVEAWSRRLVEYSPAFFADLKHDYPAAWDSLQKDLARRKALGAGLLRPQLRTDLDPEVALSMLDLIVTQVSDARTWNRLGVSRQEAVRTALAIWAGGALQNGDKPKTRSPERKR